MDIEEIIKEFYKQFEGEIINDGENEPYILLSKFQNRSIEGSQMFSVDGLIDEQQEWLRSTLTTQKELYVKKVSEHFGKLIELEKKHGFGTVSLERRKEEIIALLQE